MTVVKKERKNWLQIFPQTDKEVTVWNDCLSINSITRMNISKLPLEEHTVRFYQLQTRRG